MDIFRFILPLPYWSSFHAQTCFRVLWCQVAATRPQGFSSRSRITRARAGSLTTCDGCISWKRLIFRTFFPIVFISCLVTTCPLPEYKDFQGCQMVPSVWKRKLYASVNSSSAHPPPPPGWPPGISIFRKWTGKCPHRRDKKSCSNAPG